MLNKKASQMRFRLLEGDGKALYMIGVKDNGDTCGISLIVLVKSLFYFIKITHIIGAHIKIVRIYRGKEGFVCSIRVYLNDFENLICL